MVFLEILLLKFGTAKMRQNALEHFGRIGEHSVTDQIVSILDKDPCTRVRVEAVRTLGILRERRTVPHLIEFLNESLEPVDLSGIRENTVRALGDIGGPEVVETLVAITIKDP